MQALQHSIQGHCLLFFFFFTYFAEMTYSLYIKANNYDFQKLLINTIHILCIGQSDSMHVSLSMAVLGDMYIYIYIAIWLCQDR